MAFGGLAAACDSGTTTVVNTGVQSITLTPPSATISVGSTIQLAVSVVADANTAKTVTYTTSAASVATVDATGKVTGVGSGTATIIATSTADASKAAASVITVTPIILVNPSIAINSVTDVNGNPVTLGNVNGQINVTVNTSGGGLIEVFLSTSCASNTIAASDVAVASQQATSAQAGTVTLSFNTAQLTAANQARFANGNYCIKTRLTNGTSVVVATNTVPLTLNNANVFTATLAFASQTGGPVTAVSSLNGLNYNQGTLTVTLNPVIFTGSSPAVFISGILTRNGEIGGAPVADLSFTNQAVTAGASTIVFTDTSATGINTIFGYTSLPAGDTLYVTSATDAAGNPITVGSGGVPVSVQNARGVRIDNQVPVVAGAAFTVNAPNGYIPASYVFSTGTSGTPVSDIHPPVGGNPGVGGVTVTYYVGAAGSAAFTTANSCNVTGLTASTDTSNLQNTTATTIDQAKVIIKDALGNQVCQDITVTTNLGPSTTFGVDKISPTVVMTTLNNGAAANTGYNVSKNFSFIYNDTISGFGAGAQPLKGTLTKNFFAAGTSAAADCVIGTYSATAKTCAAVTIPLTTDPTSTPPNVVNSIEFTNGTAVPGYYLIAGTVTDLAGNVSTGVSRLAAFDNVAPAIAGLTQSPAQVVPMGAVTVTGNATDNLDLTSTKGNLTYVTAPLPFQGVTGTSFGPNFDATTVKTGSASVAIPNVYRGLQSTVAGAIQANAAAPVASVTVTDVGTNVSAPATLTVTTTGAPTNVLTNSNTLTATPTSAAPATSQASTTLTINVGGLATDIPFQSQPFTQIDIYKVVSGELVSVGTATNPSNTIQGATRTYTYTASGVALTAAATNTFYVIGRTAAGDGVISGPITVTNP
jgi:hypothetical protein